MLIDTLKAWNILVAPHPAPFFSVSTISIPLHCLLSSIISLEKPSINIIILTLKIAGDSQFMFECLLSLRVVVCRILRWLPRLPSLGISALHSPGPMNMMDFTTVTSICYMA